MGDVSSRIVDPDIFRRIAFREKYHVRLRAWAVGAERAVWQTENRVQLAIFGEHFENVAGLIREEAVVGDHYRRTTAPL